MERGFPTKRQLDEDDYWIFSVLLWQSFNSDVMSLVLLLVLFVNVPVSAFV